MHPVSQKKKEKKSFASKTRNLLVAVGLSAFVQGIYYYTIRAAAGSDDRAAGDADKLDQPK